MCSSAEDALSVEGAIPLKQLMYMVTIQGNVRECMRLMRECEGVYVLTQAVQVESLKDRMDPEAEQLLRAQLRDTEDKLQDSDDMKSDLQWSARLLQRKVCILEGSIVMCTVYHVL